ncbi:2OG-Fe(II) oxygenase [Siccirubricoccus sp. KC 17139]|uniref:2OG-Fe(II) oxygenase n=1 Tax=Siccirubricoccus soli TaxID=2899147 RepID=A0ABT1D740_9PROT|nr:2OG-Fe(II) oxygenase [Siccirubricoccus soli]MCO6417755.1 2OG-Fe(II) oxygenase [Siccirubricoccus soli]MCP2683890.1 2OG-Fe(II) oxygenase [Siccirubricoccus soli]
MPPIPPRLTPGDPAPWFFAPAAGNPRYNFASAAGRYVLVVFPGPAGTPAAAAALPAILAAQAEGLLDDRRATAFLLSVDPADQATDRLPGLRVLQDREMAVSRRYGVARPVPGSGALRYGPAAMLLDPLLRVIATAPLEQVPALLEMLRRLPPPELHAGQEVPAPVLLLPRVLEPEFCAELIAVYDAEGGEQSGFMVEREGRTVGVHDPATKRRRDCQIQDPALQAGLRERLVRRLAPEMRKAFQFNPTRIERYIVACYDGAEGGHFRAHRDNTTPGTAHRRFAVTINLNDAFEGGELWFPEFGPRRYRPPLGGACVFSCSLLHEARPVTRGLRYATLPFLYDEAAAKLREEGQKTLVAAPPSAA